MMNAVKWFVKERESNQSPLPLCKRCSGLCHLTVSPRHSRRGSMYFFATRQISRQDCRRENIIQRVRARYIVPIREKSKAGDDRVSVSTEGAATSRLKTLSTTDKTGPHTVPSFKAKKKTGYFVDVVFASGASTEAEKWFGGVWGVAEA